MLLASVPAVSGSKFSVGVIPKQPDIVLASVPAVCEY